MLNLFIYIFRFSFLIIPLSLYLTVFFYTEKRSAVTTDPLYKKINLLFSLKTAEV